jgi:hypothetical protein
MVVKHAAAKIEMLLNRVLFEICPAVLGFNTLIGSERIVSIPFHELPTTLPTLPTKPPKIPRLILAIIFVFFDDYYFCIIMQF